MQSDSKAKDVRMAEMEAALQGPTIGIRLDKVRQHGTFGQLIKQVADLTATAEKLQKTIEHNDEIILKLMAERKSIPVPEVVAPLLEYFYCQRDEQGWKNLFPTILRFEMDSQGPVGVVVNAVPEPTDYLWRPVSTERGTHKGVATCSL